MPFVIIRRSTLAAQEARHVEQVAHHRRRADALLDTMRQAENRLSWCWSLALDVQIARDLLLTAMTREAGARDGEKGGAHP